MKDALIRTTNVNLEFFSGDQVTTAVKNANISIPHGFFTIIYGASGSGKSSLLNIISGLQAPSKGQIFFDNQDLYRKTANELAYFRAEQLGIVYQTNYWVKSLSVLENVSLPLYFLGYSKNVANDLALKALNQLNMQAYAKKSPALLSGGEQQRVALARAIVSDPPVIIADEPTGNLDSKNGDMVMNLLKTLNTQQGKTIVLVTHNMEYISIAEHLLEIQDGSVTEIKQEEITSTVKSMLGNMRKRIESLMESEK